MGGSAKPAARRPKLPTGVRQRGSRFTAHGYDPDRAGGSKHLGTFDTPELAAEARRRHQDAVARKRKGFRDWRCEDFAAIWCVSDYLRPQESSNLYYQDAIRPFARDFAGVLMRDVTWDMARLWSEGGVARADLGWLVSRWRDVEQVEGGWRVRAHRSNLKAAKAMFRDALRSGLIDANPFASISIRRSRGRKDEKPPTPEQVQALVDKAAELYEDVPDIAAMIQVAAYSGLRLSELCGLRWEDVNFENPVRGLHVRRQLRSRVRDEREALPKNGVTREIVLTPQAQAALRKLPRHVDGHVFHTRHGRRLSARTWQWYWSAVRSAVPGVERMAFHMLRHFYGTQLGDRPGISPRDIAHQLGHQDGGRLAAELYCHTIVDNANARVGAVFGI